MQRSQVFKVNVQGNVASRIPTMVSTVCGLYATNLSSKTAVITDTLMKAVASDGDFATLFGSYGYTGSTYYDGEWRTYVLVSKIGSYSAQLEIFHNNNTKTLQSAYVYPVITLKNTVRFSGVGTSASPYTIAIP